MPKRCSIYYIFREIFRLLFIFVFRLKLKSYGKEFIPRKGPFLLICNHLSFLDPVVVGFACSRRLRFMARQDLFSRRLLGLWMKSVGVLSVKRDSADLSAMKTAIRALEKGEVLAVFPEGTRMSDPAMSFKEIKRGFILLAKKAGVPIVAAKIYGSEKAIPRDSSKINRGVEIKVFFSQPFTIGEDEDFNQALGRLQTVLAQL